MPANTEPGSQPLDNQRHEIFCLKVAEGKSDMEAYRLAGYEEGWEEKNAWRVRGFEGVADRIAFLQRKAEKATFLSIEEKRNFLAAALRTPLSEIDERSPLCQSAKYMVRGGIRGRLRRGQADEGNEEEEPETTTVEIKMVDKHKAIEIDNDLAGVGSAAKAQEATAESLRTIPIEELLQSPALRAGVLESLWEHEAMRAEIIEKVTQHHTSL